MVFAIAHTLKVFTWKIYIYLFIYISNCLRIQGKLQIKVIWLSEGFKYRLKYIHKIIIKTFLLLLPSVGMISVSSSVQKTDSGTGPSH